jgi:hypothetical protein
MRFFAAMGAIYGNVGQILKTPLWTGMIGLYRVGTAKKRESVKRHARATLRDQFRNAGRIKSACDSRGVFGEVHCPA